MIQVMLKKTQNDKVIARSAAVLFLLGLLTGIYVTFVATDQIDGNLGASVAAHLNGIIGALIILSLHLILRIIKFGHLYKVNMIRLFILANYSNWFLTLVKSFLDVDGLEIIQKSLANNVIHIALVMLVVIPSLVGGGMWVFGIGILNNGKSQDKLKI
ncbi:hypothetical protein [Ekhidna sp.]|uniref:hypothetical protein n=1 Tax=Ekhidna sp. TaxID=2608089 RepID=UPI003299FD99